ncbi:PilN family type IVB pilus formation outer membrane protein [Pseudomonas viridiflava]
MKIRSQAAVLSFAVASVFLAGCETKRVTETMDRVDGTSAKLSALTSSLRNKPEPSSKSVMFSNDQWVNTQPLVLKKGLPQALDCDISFNEDMSLQRFAQWVSETCKVPVRISPDALDNGASYIRNRSPDKGAAAYAGPPPAVPPAAAGDQYADLFPGYSGSNATAQAYAPSMRMGMGPTAIRVPNPKYQGKLSGLLETVTGSMGLSWRYDFATSAITVFYLETRQFSIFAFNKGYNYNSSVKSGMAFASGASSSGQGVSSGGSSSGASGDSGSNQSTVTTMTSALLDDISATVKSMLTLDQMSFSRATGVFSITDRPDVLDRVKSYLDTENEKITKQVLINVEVVSVKLSDRDQYGIDWSLVYQTVRGTWGFGLGNTMPGIDGSAVSSTISILDTAGSPWAGSKAIVQALSQQGRVSSYRAPSVTTLNLQAAPVQIGKVKGYLAASQTTQSANVGSSTALIPGSITSGFNMSLVPMVMPNKQLLMTVAISMTSEPVLETITSGTASLQTPDYEVQIFDQSVKLRSGQTLVLSGFDQTTDNASKRGTGAAWNFLFGGGGLRDTNRDVVVLMLTPIIME